MSARTTILFGPGASIMFHECSEFCLRDQHGTGRRACIDKAPSARNVPCNYVQLCILRNRDAFEFSKLSARREGLGN